MHTCRLCGSDGQSQEVAFEFKNHNVVHHLLEKKDSNPSVTRNFIINECKNCGFLYSPDYFYDQSLLYGNYITLSSAKPDEHALSIVDKITRFIDKDRISICEVGCNDGKFLKRLDPNVFYQIDAIEPALDAYTKAREINSSVVNDFFTQKSAQKNYQHHEFDCVVTRQVLEHISDLDDFMKGLHWILNENGLLVIEIPDQGMNYEHLDYSFWEEHINYFTINTARQLLQKHGFFIHHHESVLFSGKAMILYCKKHDISCSLALDLDTGSRSNYIKKFEVIKSKLQEFIISKRSEYSSVFVYGAGCRSLCTASFLGISSYINGFIDDSPIKKGRYIPGSRLEIIDSDQLQDIKHTYFLLGVNSETESKIIKKLNLSEDNCKSILPPSPRLPDFWIKEAAKGY